MIRWIRAYVVPGAVFQSVIVGGGYGTGREVVEFISRFGAWGGLAAVVMVGLLMSLVLAVTFEFARRFKLRDYRSFFKALIGRFWVVYEFFFIIGLVLVLAVTGSAAGTVLEDSFGLPGPVGIALMLVIVVVLNYSGRQWVEKTLTAWGLLMSLVLICYAILTFALKGDVIAEAFGSRELTDGWMVSGFQFFLYNVFLAPVILYATDHVSTQRQAVGAGIIAGFLAVLPGLIFHMTFMAGYPEILDEPLPTYWMLQNLAASILLIIYVVVLFGTIAQTGVGVLQGINERLDTWWVERRGRKLSPKVHGSIAAGAVLVSLLLANVGIVALVAKGYGSLSWFSLIVYVLPILIIGIFKIMAARRTVES